MITERAGADSGGIGVTSLRRAPAGLPHPCAEPRLPPTSPSCRSRRDRRDPRRRIAALLDLLLQHLIRASASTALGARCTPARCDRDRLSAWSYRRPLGSSSSSPPSGTGVAAQ